MLKVNEEWLERAEAVYPGVRRQIAYWETLDLPTCGYCGSDDTAEVSAGIIGRSIHVAGATTKIRLIPNGHPADYYCWACSRYFDDETEESP